MRRTHCGGARSPTEARREAAAQGKTEEAEELLLSGLANLRKSRGEHHPVTREAAGALIKFYQQQGRADEAAPYEPLLELPEQIEIEYELLAP